ncbi:MAG: hypothetical protein RLW62_07345 [Gammaproteobacteria bacterium]
MGSDAMAESFFPMPWREDGCRSPFVEPFIEPFVERRISWGGNY